MGGEIGSRKVDGHLGETRCSWNAQVLVREDADQGEDSDRKGN